MAPVYPSAMVEKSSGFSSLMRIFIRSCGKTRTYVLSNPAFFIGFLYLSFFVVANIVVGTIFRGFFNWIKIIYSLQLETENELQ